jgi:hypothetical protein
MTITSRILEVVVEIKYEWVWERKMWKYFVVRLLENRGVERF